MVELIYSQHALPAMYNTVTCNGVTQLVTLNITAGPLLTTVAYIRIYKVVRYHQNQIQGQLQLNAEEMQLHREKKSAFNAVFVYIVFIACYLPGLCSVMLVMTNISRSYFLATNHATFFLILLNSSLNPFVYCWRYPVIREIVKNKVKKIYCVH